MEVRMARDVERDAPLDVSSDGFAGRLEVLSGPTGRTRRSDDLKAQIAAESWAPGATVADVARRYGATRWQVYKWRQLVKRGTLRLLTAESETPAFAAVVVEEPDPEASPAPAPATPAAADIVEIVVGDVVIRAPERAGAKHLARAIRAARLAAQ